MVFISEEMKKINMQSNFFWLSFMYVRKIAYFEFLNFIEFFDDKLNAQKNDKTDDSSIQNFDMVNLSTNLDGETFEVVHYSNKSSKNLIKPAQILLPSSSSQQVHNYSNYFSFNLLSRKSFVS